MSPSPLERLLRPRSIAVIGGGTWCEAVIGQCRRMGFAGALHAVHPRRASLGGVATVADVLELPEPPDAAFVGVNRDATLEIVRALAARGAGGAVCFANGFAESADGRGRERQTALLDAAGELALLGPNCYGFVNALDGVALWPDEHGCGRVARGVAVVTQSSNIALNLSMQRRALPIAYLVTSGNQVQQGFASIGAAVLEDERVSALALHVEGFGSVPALERLAARAAELGKPIVALKSGRSAAARRATLSHTASLAGSDAGAAALLERLGIARVDTLPALVETLKLVHVHGALGRGGADADGSDGSPAPRDRCDARPSVRVASLSCSGGEAALVADAARETSDAASARLLFPALGETRSAALTAALGPRVALANPLDYDTGIWRDGAALERVCSAMSGADIDVTLLVLDLPREDRCDASDWERPIAALERAVRNTGARFALVASLPENLPESLARRLIDAGIAPLAGIDDALSALRAVATLHVRAASAGYRAVLPAGDGPAGDPVRPSSSEAALLEEKASPPRTARGESPSRNVPRSEASAKAALAAHGLAVPRGARATNPDEAATLAEALGFPIALKGEGIAHKSDAGAIALGLGDAAAVARAARAMPCTTFLVERMVDDDGGTELLVGVVRDAAHGFVLTLAAGGVLTELIADRGSLLLPVTGPEIEAALARLRIARALGGARGRPPADRRAIVDAVLAVQDFVTANATRLEELEINPLLCTPDGAVALDALLVLREDDGRA